MGLTGLNGPRGGAINGKEIRMPGAIILRMILMAALGLMLSACITLRGEAPSRTPASASNSQGGLFGGFGFGRSGEEEEAPDGAEEELPEVAEAAAPQVAEEEPADASEDDTGGGLLSALGFGRARDADDEVAEDIQEDVPEVAEAEGPQIVEDEPAAEIEPVVARAEAQAVFPGDEDEAPAPEPAPVETNQVASMVTPNYGPSSPSTFEVAPLGFDPATAPNACVNDLRVYRAHLQMPSASRFDLTKPVASYVQEAGGADTAINEVNARVDQLNLDLELELARRNPFNEQARRTSDDTIASLEDRILLNQALAEALECRR